MQNVRLMRGIGSKYYHCVNNVLLPGKSVLPFFWFPILCYRDVGDGEDLAREEQAHTFHPRFS